MSTQDCLIIQRYLNLTSVESLVTSLEFLLDFITGTVLKALQSATFPWLCPVLGPNVLLFYVSLLSIVDDDDDERLCHPVAFFRVEDDWFVTYYTVSVFIISLHLGEIVKGVSRVIEKWSMWLKRGWNMKILRGIMVNQETATTIFRLAQWPSRLMVYLAFCCCPPDIGLWSEGSVSCCCNGRAAPHFCLSTDELLGRVNTEQPCVSFLLERIMRWPK